MVCLRVPRTFSYRAGQYCDIKVPLVSNVQWHPFTIASSPHENDMLFCIKVQGDWTSKLYALFKERDGDHQDVQIHLRGPYGAPAEHVDQYEHVVLISGGVGATPFASITKYVHHWITNYTVRGAQMSNTVSAAFTRNQSVRGTPSVPGTPSRNAASSGYSSAHTRSANQSRHMSRNVSASNFARNVSSRNMSRSASRNMSRSASRNMSRSASRNGSRPNSRPGSGRLERFNSLSVPLDRVPSTKTNDSVGIIIQEQRQNQPHGPTYPMERGSSPLKPEDMSLSIPGSDSTADDSAMRRYLDMVDEQGSLPHDYDEELGNPDAPIPDRRAGTLEGDRQQPHQVIEIVREYDSSKNLFDDDDEEEGPPSRITRTPNSNDFVGQGILEGEDKMDPVDLEAGGLELEDQILREQHTASNAYNMLGMSFGPMAMLRHMHQQDARAMRSSMVRASMNLMDDAMDAAAWQDRFLFYLHSVTFNWILLWLMLLRFALVAIGNIVDQFNLAYIGLGIFQSTWFNSIDLFLAVTITVPVLCAIVMEIYMHGSQEYLADTLGNSFDLFLLLPLLFLCIALHILNFAGVGDTVQHVAKLTVFAIWPVLSLFLLWRIGRTIGSRVMLAQYVKASHAQTKSVDYLWTSKTYEDDAWLIEELLPLAESKIVRLHRFITRHGPKTEPWMLDYEKIPLKTTYTRPDWEDVFGSLVERARSGSVIGVFFCGPDNMARMVQQAAMNAMAKSVNNSYHRGYLAKKAAQQKAKEQDREEHEMISGDLPGRPGALGRVEGFVKNGSGTTKHNGSSSPLPVPVASDPSAYGCGVRISVRIENFN